jgi:hypothetical protein
MKCFFFVLHICVLLLLPIEYLHNYIEIVTFNQSSRSVIYCLTNSGEIPGHRKKNLKGKVQVIDDLSQFGNTIMLSTPLEWDGTRYKFQCGCQVSSLYIFFNSMCVISLHLIIIAWWFRHAMEEVQRRGLQTPRYPPPQPLDCIFCPHMPTIYIIHNTYHTGKFCSEVAFTYHVLTHQASCQPIFGSPFSPAEPMEALLEAAMKESMKDKNLAKAINTLNERKTTSSSLTSASNSNVNMVLNKLDIVNKYTIGSAKWMSVWGKTREEMKYSPGEFHLYQPRVRVGH